MVSVVQLAEVPPGAGSAPTVAESVAAAAQARRLRCDATSMVERMAVVARESDLAHPVAAALALAARTSLLVGPEAFASHLGVPLGLVEAAEAGSVRFGELPAAYDPVLVGLSLDLLALADLEVEWRQPGEEQGALF